LLDPAHIKASVVGFDREKAARKALNRVLTNVKFESFDSLEISEAFPGASLCDSLLMCGKFRKVCSCCTISGLRNGTKRDWSTAELTELDNQAAPIRLNGP
jgi:hypothetical protein